MGRPTKSGGTSPRELPARDWIGGYRPRLRMAPKPAATWAGVSDPQPAPYLSPTLEDELLQVAEAHPGEVAGVVFGYAGRDAVDPYVVALRAFPFPRVEPLEGGLRIPRQSWWELSKRWQAEVPELEPVGWFRIQPGQGTALASYDRFTVYQRFADPLQFTWVLDPARGRQALYRWEGSELVAVPGYWRCTQVPEVPPREEPQRPRAHPAARRAGALAGLAVVKPWLLVGAAAAALYLAVPFAPGSIASWIRPADDAPLQTPPVAETPVLVEGWAGLEGGGPDTPAPLDGASLPGDAGSPLPAAEGGTGGPVPSLQAPADAGPPAGTAAPEPYATYQVRRGETLWRISLRLLGDPTRYREIAELNGISDPHRLQVGQILRIPVDSGRALK